MLAWHDVINDKSLRDPPYKIELNRCGKIEMSPASNKHVMLQAALQRLIQSRLPDSDAIQECSVQTAAGVKVPDVAWGSRRFFEAQGEQTPFSAAPEIRVEVVPPSNAKAEMEEITALYLASGAEKVWLANLDGNITIFGTEGQRAQSRFAEFPACAELPYLRKH